MPYNDFTKLTWALDGTYYPADFNRIEDGIKNIEKYAMYREKQAENMGKAMKKLRTNQNVKIAVRGDSVMFGYNTVTSGEEGKRRVTNTVVADRNPSTYAKSLGYDGLYFYGVHPLTKQAAASGSIKASSEVTGNGTVKRTEVQIPDVFIQVLNDVYENHVTYVDRVYTGDSAVTSYMRYDVADADIEICNLGINDALAAFLGSGYVGHAEEFMKWYTNIVERNIENGVAMVIVTPITQTTVSTYDTDARTTVDVYEKILYDIGNRYGIPVFDGNELNHNFDNSMIIDFTHFNCAGNAAVGKKLAAPFIAGDMIGYVPVTNGSWIGCRPQEDSINVRGNACIEYTAKAPTFPLLLNNSDLYDTGVNRISQGIGVYMNYPLDTNVYTDQGEGATAGTLTRTDTDANLFASAAEINPLWRQADLYARQGTTGTGAEAHTITRTTADKDAYDARYNERMTFLRGKHGYHAAAGDVAAYADTGKVTWAFYADKCGTVVVPSLWMNKAGTGSVKMELDFCEMVPTHAGDYLNEMDVAALKVELAAADSTYTEADTDTKENLISRIKVAKNYNQPEDKQGRPDNIFDWNDTDTINYNYVEPSICTISTSHLSAAGYYGKRQLTSSSPVIKITTKGWHTITLKSDNKDQFIAFGLSFMSIEDYKKAIEE